MPSPTLSVVLPHYNHGAFVRQAVEALCAQSFPPLEILLVDDASTDGSQPLLRELAAAYPLARVLYNERNRGVGYTCNRALALCRGDYVHMAAADDLVLPGFFEKAMAMARRHPEAGVVYGKMAMADALGNVLSVFEVSAWRTARFASPRLFLREHLEREEPTHSLCGATVYRREPLRALGGYRTELGHWMDTFVARSLGLRHGVCYVPEPFMKWRYLERGFSRSTPWEELVRIVRRAAELMRSWPFRQWFPESHVAWWERASLEKLFRTRVTDKWPRLRHWGDAGGLRARVSRRCVQALTKLDRWWWERTSVRPPPAAAGRGG